MSEETSLNREITRIANRTGKNLSLHLEPQGDQFTLLPDMEATVVAYNSPDGRLEIEVEQGLVTVWAWHGAMLEIYQNGAKMMTDQGYIP